MTESTVSTTTTLEEAFYGGNDTFIGNQDLEDDDGYEYYEDPTTKSPQDIQDLLRKEAGKRARGDHHFEGPVRALLISVALVINLLLVLAVIRRRKTCHAIYMFATAMNPSPT